MESNAFEMLLVPVVLVTVKTLAACWIVSTLAGWARLIVHWLVARLHGGADSRDLRDMGRCLEWRRHDLTAWRGDASSSRVGPTYRRRLAG